MGWDGFELRNLGVLCVIADWENRFQRDVWLVATAE